MQVEREEKPPWSAVPPQVKDAVAEALSAPVVRATRSYGGYAPSATFRVRLANERRAFIKATFPLPEGSAVRWSLDREEVVYRRLGDVIQPWAPEYIGSIHADGWHALLLELVDAPSVLPWTGPKARRALRSYAAFHASTLGRPLPRWLSRSQHRDFSIFWRRISSDESAIDRLAALAGPRAGEARDWLRTHAGILIRAERALRRAPKPHALLHFDTRSDNVRLQGATLRIFDWPFASVGPAEFDVAAFVQSIEAEGGPRADTALGWYESALPLRRDVLIGSVASIAGYFADRAPRPAPPGLPRLRWVQRRQLKASLRWAARVLELPEPAWLAAVPS